MFVLAGKHCIYNFSKPNPIRDGLNLKKTSAKYDEPIQTNKARFVAVSRRLQCSF